MANSLLSPEFMARLEQLELLSRRTLMGRLRGERRSKRKGSSVEFADHRNYVAGDDPRFVDWNIAARLDRLFIKLFEEEEDLHFHLLIDTSRSMDFGEPTKLLFAKQVAAALAFVGLISLDRVTVWPFDADLERPMPAARGRRSLFRVLEFLEAIEPAEAGNLGQSCRTFALRNPGKGIVVILSDLLDKGGFEQGLRYLLSRRMEVFVVQILAAEEIDPELAGELRLIDVEDEDTSEITVSAPLLTRYRANVAAYREAIREFCGGRGASYLFASNQIGFERLVLTYLRERGLVR